MYSAVIITELASQRTLLLMVADRHRERRYLSRRLVLLQQSHQQLSETAATLQRRANVSASFS